MVGVGGPGSTGLGDFMSIFSIVMSVVSIGFVLRVIWGDWCTGVRPINSLPPLWVLGDSEHHHAPDGPVYENHTLEMIGTSDTMKIATLEAEVAKLRQEVATLNGQGDSRGKIAETTFA